MVLPFFLPLDESALSARAGVDESAVVTPRDLAGTSLMSSVGAWVRGRTLAASSAYSFELGGTYGRLSPLSSGGSSPAPPSTYAGNLGTHAWWAVTPGARVSVDGTALVASRLGIQAADVIAARDPFLLDRIEYAVDEQLGWSATLSRRLLLRLAGGYVGAGGLASADPSAVGVDVHGGKASVTTVHEVTNRDFLSPELRFARSHYYHAILDTSLARGAADVTTGTAVLGLTHVFGRTVMGTLAGGVTVATPPPVLASDSVVVEPDARVQLTYASSRSHASASYTYGYTSLGPRIGFGQAHAGTLELGVRPLDGAAFRDLELRGVGSVSYGSAPVAEALLNLPTAAQPGATSGLLTTLTGVLGAHLDVPLARGLFFTTGLELELVRATLSPTPPGGDTPPLLLQIVSVGLAGILSTDRRDRVRLAPADERAAALRRGDEVDVDTRVLGPGAPPAAAPPVDRTAPPPPAPIDPSVYGSQPTGSGEERRAPR